MPNIMDAVQQWNATQLLGLGQALVSAGVVAPPGGGADTFDKMRFVSPAGSTNADGKNPADPTTLAHLLANHQEDGMIVVLAAGAAHEGALEITANDVTLVGRWAGVGYTRVVLGSPLSIAAGVSRLQVYGVSLGDVVDASDGDHRFIQCASLGGARTYTRTDPKGFLVFADCNFRSLAYTQTGTGSGGTASGGDTFLTGSTELGDVTMTPNAYLKARGKVILGNVSAAGFAVLDCPGAEIEANSAPAVDMPAGWLIMDGGRINDTPGVPGTVSVAASRVNGVVLDAAGSSFGGAVPGTTGTYFGELAYLAGTPGDWAGSPPATIQDALDRLAAANPGA